MCGIAGIVDPTGAAEPRHAAVERMCAAMLHRGPDDGACRSRSGATLGMRRLAIFDPANGQQPVSSPDGRHTLVFNGAIYNHVTLRDELAAAGWAFRTRCDTEVLLAAFCTWGEQCLGRLRGMFAFAVWDEAERSLFLARDAFGIKPLYYRQDSGRLQFASELNALNASGLAPATIDPLSIAEYLSWLTVPAPRTIYRDVFSLQPGECATFRGGRLEIRPAWSFRSIPGDIKPAANRGEFSHELRARLEDTVRAHALADVPVGAYLSGGLDSAIIAALMPRTSRGRLRTFSIDFVEPGYSEGSMAAATAAHFGTDHHTQILSGAQMAGDLNTLLASLDHPTGDAINTYYASQAARAGGVKVALSGLGGDELFGGYPSFRQTPRIARWLPLWRASPPAARKHVLARLRRGDSRNRKLADALEYARGLPELAALQRRVFSEAERLALLAPDLRRTQFSRSPLHPQFVTLSADLSDTDAFGTISAWELRTYMADVLLSDSDMMSMRHSIELRVPFVDRPLIEWLWRQPAAFKRDRLQLKTALREATADLLPPGLAGAPKRGFTLPFPIWMKRELRPFLADTFSDASIDRSGFFCRQEVQRQWCDFLGGSDDRQWSRIWSLGVLIAFANRRPAPAVTRETPPVAIVATPAFRATPAATSRTLLMAPEIFASEGGIPRILQIYLRALGEGGGPNHAIRLLALNDDTIDSEDLLRCVPDGIEAASACGRRKGRFIAEALRLSRGCSRLVCGHVAQLPVAWLAARLNPNLRYYLVAHGIEVWRPFTLAEKIALRGAEKILCVSDYTRRELHRFCRLDADRTRVLPNALAPSFGIQRGRPLPDCPPTILTVARLSFDDRYKGVEHLIGAMPAVRAAVPGARLRVVGRGNDLPRLQALSHRLGLANVVEFLGFISDERLAEELSSCRLFALPSKKEGFGLVFLEAMASGRPCLGARAGGIPEVITADSGVLADYGDLPGIAQACVTALGATWDEEAILERARQFSFSRFKAEIRTLLAA